MTDADGKDGMLQHARECAVEFRSFRIVDGAVTEEEVQVVETYMFAHTGADAIPPKD